jgi:hypothetical protein
MIKYFFIPLGRQLRYDGAIGQGVLMQVPPIPAPTVPGAMPQDAVAKTLPQVQAQSGAPVIQRAIDPSPRSERGNKSRSRGDKGKGGGSSSGGNQRGGSVNIRV